MTNVRPILAKKDVGSFYGSVQKRGEEKLKNFNWNYLINAASPRQDAYTCCTNVNVPAVVDITAVTRLDTWNIFFGMFFAEIFCLGSCYISTFRCISFCFYFVTLLGENFHVDLYYFTLLAYNIFLDSEKIQESPATFSLDRPAFSPEFPSADPVITMETDTLYETACTEGAGWREGHYWRTFVGLETRPETAALVPDRITEGTLSFRSSPEQLTRRGNTCSRRYRAI